MATNVTTPVRLFRPVVLLFFFVSGITSLVLEVVWTRILGTVFGNTVLASSTVLTAFMLGLALGSVLFGRLADRCTKPLRIYSYLEMGVGLLALLFPLLSAECSQFYVWFYRTAEPGYWPLNLVRLVLSILLLLPPTMLMGGTLPVLGKHLAQMRENPGQEVGYLYGANTLGGVTGCMLAGFLLVEKFGVNGSLKIAGIAAIGIGSLALILGSRYSWPLAIENVPTRQGTEGSSLPPAKFRFLLWTFAITGFCSLACEVLWTRILLFLLSSTVYAFAVMLTTFLVGNAVGAFISTRWLVPRIRRPFMWFGVLEVACGLAMVLSFLLLARIDAIDLRWVQPMGWAGKTGLILAYLVDASFVLLLPTLLMGAAFPVVTTCCLRGEPALGRRLGQAYGANTIGCVLGSLTAGFVLVPLMGAHGGMLLIAGLNVLVGIVLLGHAAELSAPARVGWAIPVTVLTVVAAVLTPHDTFYNVINTFHSPSVVSFVKEDPGGTVSSHNLPNGDRLVAVNGVDVAGTDLMLRTTQKMQGYIPLSLHPNPQRVVQIGFGSGETARVGMEFGVKNYTVVEICPAIFEAGKLFEEINHGSYRDPRIRRIIMDGKNFAFLSGEKFDVIMNDSIFPGSSGSSALYTYDHFRNCREHLVEGGLFSCWVPLDLRPSELRMILKSFQRVFPHTSFWVASNCLNKHGLILGSLAPLKIDFSRLQTVLDRPSVQEDLASVEIHDIYEFLDSFMCDEESIAKFVASDPLNTDDHPLLEFSCAIHSSWQLRLQRTLAMLAANRAPINPFLTNLPAPNAICAELTRHHECVTHIFRAQVAELAELPRQRFQELEAASKALPNSAHVKACNNELQQDVMDLRQTLAQYPLSKALALRLADKLFVALQYPEAEQIYESVSTSDYSVPEKSLLHLATIQFSKGRADAAEATLRRCLACWPDSGEAHDLLGGLYHKAGRDSDARHHLEEAMRIDPHNELYARHYTEVGGQSSIRGNGTLTSKQ